MGRMYSLIRTARTASRRGVVGPKSSVKPTSTAFGISTGLFLFYETPTSTSCPERRNALYRGWSAYTRSTSLTDGSSSNGPSRVAASIVRKPSTRARSSGLITADHQSHIKTPFLAYLSLTKSRDTSPEVDPLDAPPR